MFYPIKTFVNDIFSQFHNISNPAVIKFFETLVKYMNVVDIC